MSKKRIAAGLALLLIAGLFVALIYVLLFDNHLKQQKILAIIFAIFFLSLLSYAMVLIAKLLNKDKKHTPDD